MVSGGWGHTGLLELVMELLDRLSRDGIDGCGPEPGAKTQPVHIRIVLPGPLHLLGVGQIAIGDEGIPSGNRLTRPRLLSAWLKYAQLSESGPNQRDA